MTQQGTMGQTCSSSLLKGPTILPFLSVTVLTRQCITQCLSNTLHWRFVLSSLGSLLPFWFPACNCGIAAKLCRETRLPYARHDNVGKARPNRWIEAHEIQLNYHCVPRTVNCFYVYILSLSPSFRSVLLIKSLRIHDPSHGHLRQLYSMARWHRADVPS